MQSTRCGVVWALILGAGLAAGAVEPPEPGAAAPESAGVAGGETVADDEKLRALSRDEAEAMVATTWERIRRAIATGEQDDSIPYRGMEMRFLEREFGDAPTDGRSLWISLHGGGGAPTEVNDQQWRNQIRLYEPAEGIYVAPRAPTDTWNLWHQAHIDPMLERLISEMVARRGVNPDKVYLLGYSAGGDGVYQLAPRMADRFAAASMMAGHPNDAKPDGLRNLPFAIFMGGKDGAYDRNKVAAAWGETLAALRADDAEGYEHRVTIYPEHGHWMNGDDREAIPWMASQTRNAWPRRVVWVQDDVTHRRFYWLEVDPEDAVRGRTIVAEVDGQRISIESEETTAVTLHLRDGLVDLDEPVIVEFNGLVVFEGAVRRTERAIAESLSLRNDPAMASTARLRVERAETP